MEVKEIEIKKIQMLDNLRMRKIEKDVHSLMSSIEANGLLQPIGVFGNEDKGYAVVWGNRRLVAIKKLGLKKIPAVIVDTDEMSEDDFLIHNAIENIQRKEVTTYELGKTCHLLKNRGYSAREIAVKLGITHSRVKQAIGDYRLIPEQYQQTVVTLNSSQKKGGLIGATTSSRIIGIAKTYALPDGAIKDLFELVKSNDISFRQLQVISIFLKDGFSVKESFEKSKEYDIKECILAFKKTDIEKLKEKYGVKYFTYLIELIMKKEIDSVKVLSRGTRAK